MKQRSQDAYENEESVYRVESVDAGDNGNKKTVSIKKGNRHIRTLTFLAFSSPSKREERLAQAQ